MCISIRNDCLVFQILEDIGLKKQPLEGDTELCGFCFFFFWGGEAVRMVYSVHYYQKSCNPASFKPTEFHHIFSNLLVLNLIMPVLDNII